MKPTKFTYGVGIPNATEDNTKVKIAVLDDDNVIQNYITEIPVEMIPIAQNIEAFKDIDIRLDNQKIKFTSSSSLTSDVLITESKTDKKISISKNDSESNSYISCVKVGRLSELNTEIRAEIIVDSINSSSPYFSIGFGYPSNDTNKSIYSLGVRSTGQISVFKDYDVIENKESTSALSVDDVIRFEIQPKTEGGCYVKIFINDILVIDEYDNNINVNGNMYAVMRGEVDMTFSYSVLRNYTPKEIYVNPSTGNDENDGSFENPLKSANEAIEQCFYNDKIILRDGIYREKVDFSLAKDLDIYAEDNAVFFGSENLSGFASVGGSFPNVYQLDITTTIPNPVYKDNRIFEYGRESLPILDDDISAFSYGLTNRINYTEIKEELSLLDCNNNAGSYYYDGVTLYLHTSDSDNPNTNGFLYENSILDNTKFDDKYENNNISLNNLKFYFSSGSGLKIYGRNITRNKVRCFGARADGIVDEYSNVISYNDISHDNGNDGINGHHYDYIVGDLNDRYNVYYFNQWADWNGGDGCSHHERSYVNIYNAMYNYNDRRGVIMFGGCQSVISDVICKNNTLEGITSASTPSDGSNKTALVANNCISEDNGNNYRCTGESVMEVKNCISVNPDSNHLKADNSGIIIDYGLKTDNTANFLDDSTGTYIDKNINGISDNFYDEGIFTPTLIDIASGATYSHGGVFTYTREGNKVFFNMNFSTISTTGTPTGVLAIDGLPFDVADGFTSMNIARITGSSLSNSDADVLTAYLFDGAQQIRFTKKSSLAAINSVTFTSGTIFISGSYITDVYTP